MATSHILILDISWCAVQFLMWKLLPEKALRIVSGVFTALWAAVVLFLTTFSRTPVLEIRMQLIPFAGQNSYGIEQTWRGMLENAVLFLPLGGLLPALLPSFNPWQIILTSSAVSLCIELVQLLSHRGIVATEDFVANTVGCAAGLLVTLAIRFIITHIPKRT